MKPSDDRMILHFPLISPVRNIWGEESWREKIVRIVYDGVLPSAVLILLTMTVNLMIAPVQVLFGPSGLLVYTLFALAVGIFSLDRSIQLNMGEPARIWFGSVSGLLIWFVMELVLHIDRISLSSDMFFILLLMTSLILITIWKPVLPVGLKFFALGFLMNWAIHFLLAYQLKMANQFRIFDNFYQACGFIAIGGAVFFVGLMLKAGTRVFRMWAALGVWISILMVLIVFFRMPV